MRIEFAQHVQVHVTYLCYLTHGQVACHDDGVGVLGQRGAHGADVVFAVVGHDIVGGDEGRHISAGLCGQIGVNFPIVALTAGAADGTVHF